jgi:hypothetical protein
MVTELKEEIHYIKIYYIEGNRKDNMLHVVLRCRGYQERFSVGYQHTLI